MSPQKQALYDLAARLSAGESEGLEAFFTDDFRLDDVGAPDWPGGRDGARRMIDAFAAMRHLQLDILDAIEEADRVAVRWGVAWTEAGERRQAAIMAIYRFVDGRIAEDWGIKMRGAWRP